MKGECERIRERIIKLTNSLKLKIAKPAGYLASLVRFVLHHHTKTMLKRRTKPTGFRKKSWFDIDLKEGLNDWQNNDDWEGDGDDDSLGNDELHIPDVDTAAEEYLSKYHICDTSDAHLAPPALSYYALDKKIIKSKKSSSKKSQSAVDDPKPFKIVSSKSANIQKWRSDTNDGWDIIEPAVPKEGMRPCLLLMPDESRYFESQCIIVVLHLSY